MRILLLNPLDKNNCTHFVVQPLGLMYIAAVLRERFNHEIKILDMKVHFMSDEDALGEIRKFSPDVVGIRTLTAEAKAVHGLVGKIKESNRRCKIIIGGPHTTGYSQKILEDSNVDFVVKGEGEVTACELIAEIEKDNDFPEIAGIGYVRNGEVVFTPSREPIHDLDFIPFPAWDLIDMEQYFKLPSWNFHISKHMTIFTSRGCPFRCAYCHNVFGKKARLRSPENVMEEIDILYNQYGIRELKVIDDIFNVNKPRVHKISDAIVEKGYNLDICFPNGLRGDIMDKETLNKLKKAGVFEITYAVETASPRIQKLIHKNIKLDRLKQVIEDTVETGIFTKGFFMMGFPSETREEIHATAKYALTSKLHWMNMFVVNPFEGTELAKMAVEMGVNIDHDNLNFTGGYKVNPNQLSEMPSKEIKALQSKTLLKFFLTPSRLISAFKCSHDKKQLVLFVFTFLIRVFIASAKKDKLIRSFYINMYDFVKYCNNVKYRISKIWG